MRLVDFEAGNPHPGTGTITITAKSPEAQRRRELTYWYNVAFVEPDKPVGRGPIECAAWIKENLGRIAVDLQYSYRGEMLKFDFADLRTKYGVF